MSVSDGHSLRTSWHTALTHAEAHAARLLAAPSSEWTRVSHHHHHASNNTNSNSTSTGNGKSGKARRREGEVVVHRYTPNKEGGKDKDKDGNGGQEKEKGGTAGGEEIPPLRQDVYRMTLDLFPSLAVSPTVASTPSSPSTSASASTSTSTPTTPPSSSSTLEHWQAVLCAPELRAEWDPAVEEAGVVEVLEDDHDQGGGVIRVCKTRYRVGWPASPRDTVTLHRTVQATSQNAYMEVSASVPRSADEPAYLRPAPPYVRSEIGLLAFHVTLRRATCFYSSDLPLPSPSSSASSSSMFAWSSLNMGLNATPSPTALATMLLGLSKCVSTKGGRTPRLEAWGRGVDVDRVRFDVGRERLEIGYGVHDHDPPQEQDVEQDRRITLRLPAGTGWDVQIGVKGSSKEVERGGWGVELERRAGGETMSLRIKHARTPAGQRAMVQLGVERATPTGGVRVNGILQNVKVLELPVTRRTNSVSAGSVDRRGSVRSGSVMTTGTVASSFSGVSTASTLGGSPASGAGSVAAVVGVGLTSAPSGTGGPPIPNEKARQKAILARVKRNYIYFSSLLQEPEAKWKRTTESRGVTITQLDSIDPTLLVYRAEATFVGVGLWDLFGAVNTVSKNGWDKMYEDAVLLEDVNELTELWRLRTKGAGWTGASSGKDAIVLKTVYKSPNAIHVFLFSAPPDLFGGRGAGVQVDLQGWAIESLSPTTTSLTLLAQSSSSATRGGGAGGGAVTTPKELITAVAGVGEFAIRCGGPPVVVRVGGGRKREVRYEHERGVARVEYVGVQADPALGVSGEGGAGVVECEIRCDVDTWAPSLDIVIDPPPSGVTCLRRHKLSAEGGGLWLSVVHSDVALAPYPSVPSTPSPSISPLVEGEEPSLPPSPSSRLLAEEDGERILILVRRGPGRERGVVNVNGAKIQVDVEEMGEGEVRERERMGRRRVRPARVPLDQPPVVGVVRRRRQEWDDEDKGKEDSKEREEGKGEGESGWTPKLSSPLARFFTGAFVASASGPMSAPPSPTAPRTQSVWDLLTFVSALPADGWTPVSDKGGVSVTRRVCSQVGGGDTPVWRGLRMVEGISAQEIVGMLTQDNGRGRTLAVLGSGWEAREWVLGRVLFPFRDRGFHVKTVLARKPECDVWYFVRVSVPAPVADSTAEFDLNMAALPGVGGGLVHVDAWVLETLDPYSEERWAVPSTRVQRILCIDWAGWVGVGVNEGLLRTGMGELEAGVGVLVRWPPQGIVFDTKEEEEGEWGVSPGDGRVKLVRCRRQSEGVVELDMVVAPPPTTELPDEEEVLTPRSSRMPLGADPLSSTIIEGLPSMSPPSSPLRPAFTSLPSASRLSLAPPAYAYPPSSGTPSQSRLSVPASTSSSAFTVKGVPPSDKCKVAELVVDSKMYPGGYDVIVTRARTEGGAVDLGAVPGLSTDDVATPRPADSPTTATSMELGLTYTISTLPLSPLHAGDVPTRHLVRLVAGGGDGSWVVRIVVRPRAIPPTSDLGTTGRKRKKTKVTVYLNGEGAAGEDAVIGDGAQESADGDVKGWPRVSRRSGSSTESDQSLLAVDYSLLLPTSPLVRTPAMESLVNDDEVTSEGVVNGGGVLVTTTASPPSSPSPPTPPPLTSTVSSFWDYFRGVTIPPLQPHPGQLLLPAPALPPSLPSTPTPTEPSPASTPTIATRRARTRDSTPRTFTRSTLLVTALIAFLLGSLMRALLSPADFIYVVKDLDEVKGVEGAHGIGEGANGGGLWDESGRGWREIRRLVEVKWVAGGWDLQVAVVRRH